MQKPPSAARTALLAILLCAVGLLLPMAVAAQEDPLKWLPPGSRIETTLAEYPVRAIISEQRGGTPGYLARLGELVFRSPLTLGRDAARRGISCEACHTNGAANTSFTLPGASDQPGNVDLTHLAFHFREDDGSFNPVNIPSLRGVRWTAPYGHDGRFPTLRAFSHNVITREFGGPPLDDWLMDALVAWQMEFGFTDALPTDPTGAAYQRHCRSCHGDARQLPPRRVHDIGTGQPVEAPVLRGLAETAPYLHDGSAATVADAVSAHAGLDLTAAELSETVADATRLGAMARRHDPETLDGDVARLNGFIDLIHQQLLDEAGARADQVGDMVAMEIGRIYRRFDPAAVTARDLIRNWARALARATQVGLDGDHPAARDLLADLKAAIATDLPRLRAQGARSLYAAAGPSSTGGDKQ